MNIVTAARRRLLEAPLPGTARVDKFKLTEEVAGKGTIAIVLSVNGSWRNTMQTAMFPRLAVLVYADNSRSVDGAVISSDSADRAMDTWKVVDDVFHSPLLEEVVWGGEAGVHVVFRNREALPSFIEHPDPAVAILRATYNLKVY